MKENIKTEERVVRIPPPNYGLIEVTVGNQDLPSMIVHRLGEKAEKELKDRDANKIGGRTRKRPPRDPKAEYEDSMYRMPGKKNVFGTTAAGFKHAMVTAAATIDGIFMNRLKRQLWVLEDAGGLVKIVGKQNRREDVVRIGKGQNKVPQFRYRGEFKEWTADLKIRYDADEYDSAEILNLLARAGQSVGINELRLEKGYDHGGWVIIGRAKVTGCAD